MNLLWLTLLAISVVDFVPTCHNLPIIAFVLLPADRGDMMDTDAFDSVAAEGGQGPLRC